MGEMLNRINFQVEKKNHSAVYQSFAKTLGLSKEQRKAGLTFDQCVTLLHKTKRDSWQVKPVKQLFFDIFGQYMNNNKVRKKVSAESFLNRFLQTVQGEEDRTLDDVMKIFSGLHELELADVANHITQANYISLEQFEAYLVGSLSIRCYQCTACICLRSNIMSTLLLTAESRKRYFQPSERGYQQKLHDEAAVRILDKFITQYLLDRPSADWSLQCRNVLQSIVPGMQMH